MLGFKYWFGMVFVTLMPVGYIQLKDALEHGYWHSRLTSFYEQPLVKAIMGRMPWDIIFTVGVIILVVIFIRIQTLKTKIQSIDHHITE